MKRRSFGLIAIVAVVVAVSGCSVREVQLWFQATGRGVITTDQATRLADAVNAKRPTGCDANYAPAGPRATTCVPDNATAVHCEGTSGSGPAVAGPLRVVGWDSFGLDPDGDKVACADPVGRADLVGQVLEGVEVDGWAFDPDSADPVTVKVTANGVVTTVTAADSRPDVGAAFPGVGDNRGFHLRLAADPGDVVAVCVAVANTGPGADTSLGCKSVTVLPVGVANGSSYRGLLEGVDAVPGGWRVRGFVVQSTDDGGNPPYYPMNTELTSESDPGPPLFPTVVRDDAAALLGLPAGTVYGFDTVVTNLPLYSPPYCLRSATQLLDFTAPATSCRQPDS